MSVRTSRAVSGRITPHPARPAVLQQHRQEGQIVLRRRHQSGPAREQGHRSGIGLDGGAAVRPASGGRVVVQGRHPAPLFGRHAEPRVIHADRIEQPPAQEVGEAHARGPLDNQAEHVQGGAVAVGRPRLGRQGKLAQPPDHLVQIMHPGRFPGVQIARVGKYPGPAIGRRHRAIARDVVAQAAGVGQQMPHRHHPGRRPGVQPLLRIDRHRQARELRHEIRHGLIQRQFAVLDQQGRRRPGDRLAHGIDAKDGVPVHGRGGAEVLGSRLQVDVLVVGEPQAHCRARQPPVRDIAVQNRLHLRKARGVRDAGRSGAPGQPEDARAQQQRPAVRQEPARGCGAFRHGVPLAVRRGLG